MFGRFCVLITWVEEDLMRIGGDWRRIGEGLEKDWRRIGEGSEKDRRRIGEGLEKDWRRIGDGPPMPSCFVEKRFIN